ncbi:MAG: diacylglycerol kinase [Rhodobacteraceae bacterium]|nr:diacylglycerol kinase [Paracoccaceae bacterium]
MRIFLQGQWRRLLNTFTWSFQGWMAAWSSEMSLRQWTVINVLSAGLALYLPLSVAERALILALGLLVLAAELFNTAIEEVVDHITPYQNPAAKKAKDCGSAGVALAALAGGLAWLVILIG